MDGMIKSINVKVEYDSDVITAEQIICRVKAVLPTPTDAKISWEQNIDSTVDVMDDGQMVLFDLEGNSYEAAEITDLVQAVTILCGWQQTYNFDMWDTLQQLQKIKRNK